MSEVKTLSLPKPIIQARTPKPELLDEAQAMGIDPLMARVIASRPIQHELKTWFKPTLKDLDSPSSMADMDKASDRLIQAIVQGEVIGIETDHDCDGQTSHAVIYQALTDTFQHPKEKVASFIGHRMQEGYGLSDSLAKRILATEPRPTLVITADNGSSDEPRIKMLKEEGIDVIVTDHHSIPETGIPASAHSVLNPTRDDCQYPDPYIAGCMVAWLYMSWTRSQLVKGGHLGPETPSLKYLLDYIAVGTVADCVSLSKSLNNRIVTRAGLAQISQFERPCWRALKETVANPITSEDLGFRVAPMLNSDGRLSCAFGSVSFLMSDNDIEALKWSNALIETNQERKAIQNNLTDAAIQQALEIDHPNKKSLTIFLPEGHAGVHGISASRLKDAFGKPVFIFSPKVGQDHLISGSGRSIDECHLREALGLMHEQNPDLMDKFGGHRGAAGVTIPKANLEAFSVAFEQACQKQVDFALKPILLSDGPFDDANFDVEYLRHFNRALEPFGREFEAPLFEWKGEIQYLTAIGKTKTHAKFTLIRGDKRYPCVWFSAKQSEDEPFDVQNGDTVTILFSPTIDTFRDVPSVKAMVRHVELTK